MIRLWRLALLDHRLGTKQSNSVLSRQSLLAIAPQRNQPPASGCATGRHSANVSETFVDALRDDVIGRSWCPAATSPSPCRR